MYLSPFLSLAGDAAASAESAGVNDYVNDGVNGYLTTNPEAALLDGLAQLGLPPLGVLSQFHSHRYRVAFSVSSPRLHSQGTGREMLRAKVAGRQGFRRLPLWFRASPMPC